MSTEFVQNVTWTMAGVVLLAKLLPANYAVDQHMVAAAVCDVQ